MDTGRTQEQLRLKEYDKALAHFKRAKAIIGTEDKAIPSRIYENQTKTEDTKMRQYIKKHLLNKV